MVYATCGVASLHYARHSERLVDERSGANLLEMLIVPVAHEPYGIHTIFHDGELIVHSNEASDFQVEHRPRAQFLGLWFHEIVLEIVHAIRKRIINLIPHT